MNITIVNDIKEKSPEKIIQKCCKKIQKKLSMKSVKDIGNVTELVNVLYINGQREDAIKVCDLLKDLEFIGDYTIWENVKDARLMKAHILRELDRSEEADHIVNEIMKNEDKKVWNNQIKCLQLYDTNIEAAKERNAKKEIMGWRLIKFEMLIRFYELPNFPVNKMNIQKEILNLSKELRESFE